MKQIVQERKDIAFEILLYAPAHANAQAALEYIICGKDDAQRLARFEESFDKKPAPKAECQSDVIANNKTYASAKGIKGTPHMVLPDGTRVNGFVSKDVLMKLIGLSAAQARK